MTISPTQAMHHALNLAKRGLGSTAENPAVGCVIVKGGVIIGRGYTQSGGRPHAETVALAQAGANAEDAEVFVTLEPCSHHGKTPPCVDALITSKVSKVWIALGDPNPEVAGTGIERLQQAGIEVEIGLCFSEALFLNQGYIMRRTINRPMVSAKIAVTQDGKLALANGKSQWITNQEARNRGHLLRAGFDCLLSGIGTVLADNPAFTCRLAGLEKRLPLRAICDTFLRIPDESTLVQQANQHPILIYCSAEAAQSMSAQYLRNCGVQIQGITLYNETIHLPSVLSDLAKRGINRVLLEAGETLTTSAFSAHLVDRLFLFRGNYLFGGDAQPALGNLFLEEISQAPRLHPLATEHIKDNQLETFLVEYPEASNESAS